MQGDSLQADWSSGKIKMQGDSLQADWSSGKSGMCHNSVGGEQIWLAIIPREQIKP